MSILDAIIERKQKQIQNLKTRKLLYKDVDRIVYPIRDFSKSLKKQGLSIIAEIKKRSPSAGVIKEDFNPVQIAKDFEDNGADAISVLTERYVFGGYNYYLTAVKEKIEIPILRKDFIIDPHQIYESKFIGADCILLIKSILDKKTLKEFICRTKDIGLSVLVEVHSAGELDDVLSCGAEMIGINNRNLKTFKVNIETSINLAKTIPGNIIKISESGIRSDSDVKSLKDAGFDGVLIGETLMRSNDPGEIITRFKNE